MAVAQPEGDSNRRELLERLPLATDRPWVGVLAAIAGSAIGAGIRYLAVLPPGFPFVTFLPSVVLVSLFFGFRAGLLNAIIAGGLAWALFVGPERGFVVDGPALTAMLFYAGVVAVDLAVIFWMQTAFARLSDERRRTRALAETRALLFRELQHRVSNNLQVVGALLALQKRDIVDPKARHALDEASRRLGVIGRIHRQLYEPTGDRIGLSQFLTQIGRDVIDTSGRNDVDLSVEADTNVDLPPDAAIPVALVTAEAIANAIEHGFPSRPGAIRVTTARLADGSARVDVADNGRGLADGFALEDSGSLGLRIAATLAQQLGGRFELLPGEGTIARLTLPAAAMA